MTACSIHNRGEWNKRGMTWLEEYVNDNIKSIIGAPFVVSFIDDSKTMPSGHGTLTYDEKGNCQFLDSDTVGTIQKAWIQEVKIEGTLSKKLVVSGFLYNQRHPNFVNWLKDEVNSGTNVKGSVEATGKGDSKTIVYEGGGNGKDEDGNWILGRIPQIFDFSGLALLLPDIINPADDGSEVMEINTLQSTDDKSDDIETNKKHKEENYMGDLTKETIIELNNTIVELNKKISENNSQIESKDTEIASLKEKETELNSLLVEANKTIESHKTQVSEMNAEIEPLRQIKNDLDAAIAQSEVNSYFETIKAENGFTDVELNSLKADYVDKCDLAGLKVKEQELCVEKLRSLKKATISQPELNSETTLAEGLFFSTKAVVVETNSADDGSDLFK